MESQPRTYPQQLPSNHSQTVTLIVHGVRLAVLVNFKCSCSGNTRTTSNVSKKKHSCRSDAKTVACWRAVHETRRMLVYVGAYFSLVALYLAQTQRLSRRCWLSPLLLLCMLYVATYCLAPAFFSLFPFLSSRAYIRTRKINAFFPVTSAEMLARRTKPHDASLEEIAPGRRIGCDVLYS